MSTRETCGKQNDKNRICKNAHIRIAEYVHFIYFSTIEYLNKQNFYKNSLKNCTLPKKLGTGKKQNNGII